MIGCFKIFTRQISRFILNSWNSEGVMFLYLPVPSLFRTFQSESLYFGILLGSSPGRSTLRSKGTWTVLFCTRRRFAYLLFMEVNARFLLVQILHILLTWWSLYTFLKNFLNWLLFIFRTFFWKFVVLLRNCSEWIKVLRRFQIFDFGHTDFNFFIFPKFFLDRQWNCRRILSSHDKHFLAKNILDFFFKTMLVPHGFDFCCESIVWLR